MKAEIHPEYQAPQVRCACGNEFTTRSTTSEIRVARPSSATCNLRALSPTSPTACTGCVTAAMA